MAFVYTPTRRRLKTKREACGLYNRRRATPTRFLLTMMVMIRYKVSSKVAPQEKDEGRKEEDGVDEQDERKSWRLGTVRQCVRTHDMEKRQQLDCSGC
jgi:hypothetical protein